MLGHGRVEVVLNHEHNGRRLLAFGGIFFDGARIHGVGGAQTIHVDTTVGFQLFGKFGRQLFVVFGRKITQGVAKGQLLFFRAQNVFALGRVAYRGVVGRHFGQNGGNAFGELFLKIVHIA